jgi:cytochrome c
VRLAKIDLTGLAAVSFLASAPPQLGGVGGTIEIRRDSLSGPLLGETEAIRPTAAAAGAPAPVRAVLAPTPGVHDLYFVFRNPQAARQQPLFVVMTATFESAAAPAQSGPR